MELELFVRLTPTAISECLVPPPFQVFGKLLPKSTNRIFCEQNACAVPNATSARGDEHIKKKPHGMN